MPNWTDDEGFSWFMKVSCKRCLQVFDLNDYDHDPNGGIPCHKCLDNIFVTSKTEFNSYNVIHGVPCLCTKNHVHGSLKGKKKKKTALKQTRK